MPIKPPSAVWKWVSSQLDGADAYFATLTSWWDGAGMDAAVWWRRGPKCFTRRLLTGERGRVGLLTLDEQDALSVSEFDEVMREAVGFNIPSIAQQPEPLTTAHADEWFGIKTAPSDEPHWLEVRARMHPDPRIKHMRERLVARCPHLIGEWDARGDAPDFSCVSVSIRCRMLRAIADAADARRSDIIATAADETALTADELAPEFERMTGTLRMFASLIEAGTWTRATIDTPHAVPLVGPAHDIRSMLMPLGPVAVFGASNFPLAYGVLGGDTASAMAAGCPVVVKEHPAHPRTGRLLADLAQRVISGIHPLLLAEHHEEMSSRLKYVRDEHPDPRVGQALVAHPSIKAVGFTGSREGGLALAKLAGQRKDPIPVFAEMGSANRVLICAAALRNRAKAIANELATSILSRHGQQCTKAGLIFLDADSEHQSEFITELTRLVDAAKPRVMLSDGIARRYREGCARLQLIPHLSRVSARDPKDTLGPERRTVPVLFASTGDDWSSLNEFEEHTPGGIGSWLRDEVFGPAAIVLSSSWRCFKDSDPSLVTTIYADPEDLNAFTVESDEERAIWQDNSEFTLALRTSGRLTFNSPTTGVRVATSMVHGGPYPATNVPHTTAVGPRAIERWCRPVCFQNCPDTLLPPELQNANPRGILRTVNGVPTRDGL